MHARTVLHRTHCFLAPTKEAVEYLLPCQTGAINAQGEMPQWVLQFLDVDRARLSRAWTSYVGPAERNLPARFVHLIKRLAPDGLLPFEGRYWLHLGSPDLPRLPGIVENKSFFQEYRTSTPGFYLPAPPICREDAKRIMALLPLPTEQSLIDFFALFGGLREDTPMMSGHFTEVTEEWPTETSRLLASRRGSKNFLEWQSATPVYWAVNSDVAIIDVEGRVGWSRLAEKEYVECAPNFANFIELFAAAKQRNLSHPFDSYAQLE